MFKLLLFTYCFSFRARVLNDLLELIFGPVLNAVEVDVLPVIIVFDGKIFLLSSL
jgi:hypothetical protein